MIKRFKDSTIAEKIAIIGVLLCAAAILALIGIELFADFSISSAWLSFVCSINLILSSIPNRKSQKGLSNAQLVIGAVIFIASTALLIFK